MSEEQVEAIFQHACEGAAESIGSTRVDWQRVVDAIRFLRRELEASESLRSATISTMRRNEAELTEARRLLDGARAQVPYAYEHGVSNGDGTFSVHITRGDMEQIGPSAYAYCAPKNPHKDWPVKPLYAAAPVPAQPSDGDPIGYIGTDGVIRRTPPSGWKPLPLRTPAPVPAQPAAAIPAGWRVLDDGHRVTVCWDGAGYTLDARKDSIHEAFCGFVRDVVKSAAASPQPTADVADICNAYESGAGHAGRPTAKVNPYREGTPEHDAYALGAARKGE